ncbi:MAG: AarF/UbiB family protein [Candidatus Levybacteria bacterium]|nr:AarF/UbiB family protein [Candidatus Levybacteria bacterium]
MFRILYITGLLFKYAFILLLAKFGLKKIQKPKFFRKFFEEAAGAFIKFGQLISLRVDILSNDYAVEFFGLLDNVTPFSYSEVEAIFIEELGATPNKIFKDFQKKPFASASFGQVHGAKLLNDEVVAVKVMRPGIEAKVKIDFLILDFLAFFADIFFKIDALPWKEFLSEFKVWTRQELDYRIEAEHGEKFYQNHLDSQDIVVPKIYHDLTTKMILVEEYIEGVHLSRVLRRLKDGRLDEEKLKEMGINLKKIPHILAQDLLKQYLFNGFFHADPHPGNIILLKNDKVAFVDFGIMGGESSMPNQKYFVKMIIAGANCQFKEATLHMANFAGDELKSLLRSAMPATVKPEEIDGLIALLTDNFSETVTKIVTTNLEELRHLKKDYIILFMQIIKSAKRYRVKLPKEIVILIRTLSVLGLLAKQMDFYFYLSDEIINFFKEYPEEMFTKDDLNAIPLKRINRELALERLSSWLSYLVEVDPAVYHLVKNYLSKYTVIDA